MVPAALGFTGREPCDGLCCCAGRAGKGWGGSSGACVGTGMPLPGRGSSGWHKGGTAGAGDSGEVEGSGLRGSRGVRLWLR